MSPESRNICAMVVSLGCSARLRSTDHQRGAYSWQWALFWTHLNWATSIPWLYVLLDLGCMCRWLQWSGVCLSLYRSSGSSFFPVYFDWHSQHRGDLCCIEVICGLKHPISVSDVGHQGFTSAILPFSSVWPEQLVDISKFVNLRRLKLWSFRYVSRLEASRLPICQGSGLHMCRFHTGQRFHPAPTWVF